MQGNSLNTRIHRLDGLRGVLSLMVALYHFPQEYLPGGFAEFFVLRQANIFVDVFFVLSGFVISYRYSTIDSMRHFIEFLKKRLLRLYPLLFYSVTVVLILSLAQFILHRTIMPKGDELSLLSLFWQYLDSILMLNSTPLLGSTLGLNFPSWSISAEMFSYLFFGIILLFLTKYQKRWFLVISLICLSILIIIGSYYETGNFGFVRGILNFSIGYFVCHLYSRYQYGSMKWLGLVGVCFILINLYMLNNIPVNHKDYFAFCSVPWVAGFLVFSVVVSKGIVSRFLSTKPLRYLGKLSYSIYLNHIFLSGMILKSYSILLGQVNTTNDRYLIFIYYVIMLLLYSGLTYKYIEEGGRRFLQKLLYK